MSRSLKKGPYVDSKLLKLARSASATKVKQPIRTWARRSVIVPDFVGSTFLVHNGKTHQSVYVTEEMVGHKLGEFSPTRVFRGHSGVNKK